MEIVDTHCHLDVSDFDLDRNTVIEHCRNLHINKIVVPGIHEKTWSRVIELCSREKGLYPALGLHPVFLQNHTVDDLKKLEDYLVIKMPIAIGEIGMDFYIKNLDPHEQEKFFSSQLDIAKNNNLPVILHVRKAHDKVLQILKKIKVKGGFCHAFNGSLQQAEKYIKLGFKLGFGGTLTYEKSNKIRALAATLPLESIVLETDAPDMVVESHRGERNSPEYVVDALAALANIRNEEIEFVAEQTTNNANEVMNFSEYDRQYQ